MMRKRLVYKRGIDKSFSSRGFLSHYKYQYSNARHYEFSCSNSPNRVYFRVLKKKRHFFSCTNLPKVVEEPDYEFAGGGVVVPKTPEYDWEYNYSPDRRVGKKCSLVMPPFVGRVSNYSSDDEGDKVDDKVDLKAEEFIKRFYEQLRVQY